MTDSTRWLSYPDAPRIRHVPPGPRSRELLGRQAEWESEAISYPRSFPIAIDNGLGATIEDVDGNRFIDWMSGISVLNLGHRHPRLVAALQRQAEKAWHTLELPTEARIEFLRELRDVLPGTLRNHAKVLFTVTGGDAIETGVNLAEFAQQRKGTIAFSGAYHGVHGGAANLTAGKKYHETTAFHGGTIVRVPFPDPYRPVLERDESSQGTLRFLEHLVADPYSGADKPAAVLVEPILGEGGYIVPPDDFLPSLREFCDRHGLLLILDEVQTGLGRTGRMWACEHTRVTPDILCIAKTIGGGLPLSLVAYREDLAPSLPPGFHLGTFRGNALALALGTEVLKVLREDDWPARTATRGRALLERFRAIGARHASVGNVRGRGFMIGVEFVHDPATRRPWGDRARALRRELFLHGVLMHTCGPYDQVLRFMGPLIIEEELLERGLAIFDESLAGLEGVPPGPPISRAAPQLVRPAGVIAPSRIPTPAPPIPGTPPTPGRTLD